MNPAPPSSKSEAFQSSPSAHVVRSVKEWIRQGVLVDGQPLPSERALAEKLGVARKTVRRALAMMEEDGLLRAHGGGPRVITLNTSARGRLMENAVVVLTRITEQSESGSQRTSGREGFITHGAMQAVHACGWHGIYLQPSLLTDMDLHDLVAERPRGVIITDMSARTEEALIWATALRDAGIPVVIYDGAAVLSDFDRVVSDHEDGYYQLTKWLIGQGRRRIMPMWWRSSIAGYWYLARCGGYARAMLEAGLQPLPILDVPNLTRTADDLHAWLRVCTEHFAEYLKGPLSGDNPVDALMMDSDGSVPAAAAACRKLGFEPNNDVLIAGYDNYWADVAEYQWEPTAPAVTVDKQNLVLGAELVRLLKERMDGLLPAQAQCRVVRPQLVIPDSVA